MADAFGDRSVHPPWNTESTTKDLRAIRGRAPDPRAVPSGCPFHPRCTQAEDICASDPVALDASCGRAALARSRRAATRTLRRRVQLVAQDPWDALSPRLSVIELAGEPLVISGERAGMGPRVAAALESVGLASTGAFLDARTGELSGGQLQRISVAAR